MVPALQLPNIHVTSLLDLGGLRMAVLEGSVQQEYLGDLAAGFGLKVSWVSVASFDDARVLERGERVSGEEINTTRLGEQRLFLCIKTPLRDAQGAILALDLNDFTMVNDTLGHGIGDHLSLSLGTP